MLDGYLKNQRLLIILYSRKPFLVVVTPTQRDVPVGLQGRKKACIRQKKTQEKLIFDFLKYRRG